MGNRPFTYPVKFEFMYPLKDYLEENVIHTGQHIEIKISVVSADMQNKDIGKAVNEACQQLLRFFPQ